MPHPCQRQQLCRGMVYRPSSPITHTSSPIPHHPHQRSGQSIPHNPDQISGQPIPPIVDQLSGQSLLHNPYRFSGQTRIPRMPHVMHHPSCAITSRCMTVIRHDGRGGGYYSRRWAKWVSGTTTRTAQKPQGVHARPHHAKNDARSRRTRRRLPTIDGAPRTSRAIDQSLPENHPTPPPSAACPRASSANRASANRGLPPWAVGNPGFRPGFRRRCGQKPTKPDLESPTERSPDENPRRIRGVTAQGSPPEAEPRVGGGGTERRRHTVAPLAPQNYPYRDRPPPETRP